MSYDGDAISPQEWDAAEREQDERELRAERGQLSGTPPEAPAEICRLCGKPRKDHHGDLEHCHDHDAPRTFYATESDGDKLRARITELEATLEPFAKIGRLVPKTWRGDVALKAQVSRDDRLRPALVDDYRRAAEALAGEGE